MTQMTKTKHQEIVKRSLTLDQTKLYYLASPYTAPTREQEHRRYMEITKLAIRLIKEQKLDLILPITTSHALREVDPTVGTTWEAWEKTDINLLRHSDILLVAMMPGVYESKGVAAEVVAAAEFGIEILFIDPLTLAVWKQP